LVVDGVVVLGVDDEGVVVVGVEAAPATALLSPNPTPAAAPDTPTANSTLAKRLLIFRVLSSMGPTRSYTFGHLYMRDT
jgi:hypothetical protein